jgi:hypothetical protein
MLGVGKGQNPTSVEAKKFVPKMGA